MKKYNFMLPILILLLYSCTSINYTIDSKKYSAVGKNSRIRFIVLHYTATNDDIGIKTLTTQQVSAHYLITSKDSDPIYNLVPENERAWHAGTSEFRDRNNINDTSIGIEITNIGVRDYSEQTKEYGFYIPYDKYEEYTEGEIKKVAYLLKDILKRYKIAPTDIVGHSDVAPLRKIDPGAKFPWKRLYDEYGIGAWYDENDRIFYMNETLYKATPISQIKYELRKYGYKINSTNEWDEESKRVVYAFQSHFNPEGATGDMDLNTYAILKALNRKYR